MAPFLFAQIRRKHAGETSAAEVPENFFSSPAAGARWRWTPRPGNVASIAMQFRDARATTRSPLICALCCNVRQALSCRWCIHGGGAVVPMSKMSVPATQPAG